jgi:hypothetical protein
MPSAHILTDNAMQAFIRNGYVTVHTDFAPAFHRNVHRKIEDTLTRAGNPGNNLLPRVPEIQEIFDHPAVHGALASILGPSFYLHPHRYCHVNHPGQDGQRIHKDSWSKRHHRTRWAMAFYYPQDTTEDMGPTGVVPGSQYYNDGPPHTHEASLTGPAGTVTIVHYDLWHRATPNRSDKTRYMVKFLFTRLDEPEAPSWASQGTGWPELDAPEQLLWKDVWNWHSGSPGLEDSLSGGGGDVPSLLHTIRTGTEQEGFRAAYTLGAVGAPALGAAIDLLAEEDEALRRHAGYALTAMGSCAVEALAERALDRRMPLHTRAAALDILGDIGRPAATAVPAIARMLGDEAVEVRRAAADALGTMNGAARSALEPLSGALQDEDEWVGRNAALALLRMGRAAEEAVPALIRALRHPNRYVRAKAAKTLERIGTADALEAALRFYETAMWCAITDTSTPY